MDQAERRRRDRALDRTEAAIASKQRKALIARSGTLGLSQAQKRFRLAAKKYGGKIPKGTKL